MGKYAYATLVTKKHYVEGALNLYYSLQRVHSEYPLILIIPEKLFMDAEEQISQRFKGCIFKIFADAYIDQFSYCNIKKDFVTNDYNMAEVINKLRIFDYTEFDYILFIDADMLIMNKDIDKIFENKTLPIYGCYYPNNGARAIGGDFFLIKPVQGLYSSIKKHLTNESTEEEVLTKLFPWFATTQEAHFSPEYREYLAYHDNWTMKYPKYWTWIKIDPNWFLQMSDHQMKFLTWTLKYIAWNYWKYVNQMATDYIPATSGEEIVQKYWAGNEITFI